MEIANIASNGEKSSLKGAKAARIVNHIDLILKRSRNLYSKLWDDHSIEAKKKSLAKAEVEGCNQVYTPDVFHREFANRVEKLVENLYFQHKCKEIDLSTYSAATHIVMMSGLKGIEALVINHNYDGKDTPFIPYEEWKLPVIDYSVLRPFLGKHISAEMCGVQTTDEA